MWRSLLLLGILTQANLALAADAASSARTTRTRAASVPTISDIIDSRWSATWCVPGFDYATIAEASLPEKFTRLGYAVRIVERPDTDPEFWKRASDFRIEGSELRSMPKGPDGMYHLRGVVDAQIVKIATNESIGEPVGQVIDIYGPDCDVPAVPKKEEPTPPSPPQPPPPQQPAAPRQPPAPQRPANVCETSECSVLVRIMKADGEPCAYCHVMFTWSGMGFGTSGDATRLTNARGFVEFRSPVRYLSSIATIVNKTGLVMPLRFNVDTLGGTSLTIKTPYTGR